MDCVFYAPGIKRSNTHTLTHTNDDDNNTSGFETGIIFSSLMETRRHYFRVAASGEIFTTIFEKCK